MSILDSKIFKGKKFSDLLSEIYDNQKDKEKLIKTLISELKPLVQDMGSATLVVPLIKEYLEIGVKNDEQLIKVANTISKIISSGPNKDNRDQLSEEEKNQLLDSIDGLKLDD